MKTALILSAAAASLTTSLALPAPATAQEDAGTTLAEARASVAGNWRGELQYRDYQSDQWIGLPVAVEVAMMGDGVTMVRQASFDEGPSRATVYITNVNMLAPDGSTEYVANFRADRPAESGQFTVALVSASDAENWTMTSSQEGYDANRPARIRETTIREGASLVTLKEVDFLDDEGEEWLSRNRIVLELVG